MLKRKTAITDQVKMNWRWSNTSTIAAPFLILFQIIAWWRCIRCGSCDFGSSLSALYCFYWPNKAVLHILSEIKTKSQLFCFICLNFFWSVLWRMMIARFAFHSHTRQSFFFFGKILCPFYRYFFVILSLFIVILNTMSHICPSSVFMPMQGIISLL